MTLLTFMFGAVSLLLLPVVFWLVADADVDRFMKAIGFLAVCTIATYICRTLHRSDHA